MKEIIPTDYCTETIALKRGLESGFIVLAERLSKIKAEQMWQEQWSSFSEYLAEMKITDATASKLIAVHSLFVDKFNVDEALLTDAGWSSLYEVRGLISDKTTKHQVEDLVKKVSILKRDDTRELVRASKNGECPHSAWFIVHFRQCKECGVREKIFD